MSTWRLPGGAGWGPTLIVAAVPAADRGGVGLGRAGGCSGTPRTASTSTCTAWAARPGSTDDRCTPTARSSRPRAASSCLSPTRRWPRSLFSPFALLSLNGASLAITLTTLILLIVSTVIVLTRLDVWPTTAVTTEPAWLRRCWLAAAIVAPAVIYLEPIRSNFDFGQINVVLMTLVIADCVPRRDPVAARRAAWRGDRAQADARGVPAVLPAAPRHPRTAGHGGVRGGRHAGRLRVRVARLRGSTGPRQSATPTGSAPRR